MIKRYLCCLGGLITTWHNFTGPQTGLSGRFVFANTPAQGSGGTTPGVEAEKIKLTLENLEEGLEKLRDEGKLTDALVNAAKKAIAARGNRAKKRILTAAKLVQNGSYTKEDFEERLLGISEEEPEAGEKPAAEEGASKEAKEKPKAEKAAEEIKDPQIEAIKESTKSKVEQMMETADAMEQAYLKRETMTDKLRQNFEKYKSGLTELNGLDRKNNDEADTRVKEVLEPLVLAGKITKEDAALIADLDAVDPDFENGTKEDKKLGNKEMKGFKELTANLDEGVRTKLRQIKEAQAEKNRALEKDARKMMHELRKVMDHLSDAITQKADRERAVNDLIQTTGVNLKPGQKLSYDIWSYDEKTKEGKLIPKTAVIKEVKFLDESAPVIVVESENSKGEKVEDLYSPPAFLRMIDAIGATEKIDSLQELEKSIGVKIEEGDNINYVVQMEGDSKLKIEERELKVEKLDQAEKMITLSEDVQLTPRGTPTRRVTLGEFAKWFKRKEGAKEIKSLNELRSELDAFNEAQNAIYGRKSGTHPPIELKKDEILKYDDGSDRSFVIKDINDKEITLDNDDKYSPTGFLRWVKKNEVEKFDPASEAARETELSGDEEERAKLEAEKAAEAARRLEEAKKEPGTSDAHASSHERAGHSKSYLKKLWAQTRFISPYGLFEMGKTIVELFKRKLKRNEHDRVGTVGARMFGPIWTELGAEFKSVAQHAENEEVDHHLKHYRTMGYDHWIHELHEAPTKDILKAAITVLCEKGQMRWDDEGFWHAMNKYTFGELKDKDGNDLIIKADNYMEAIEKYLDHWWGQDTFRELRNKQDSSYNSIKSNFNDHAARLEGDPDKNGGLKGALQSLLYKHLKGEHVNAAQFESYLHYAIEQGKLGFEDKLFFLMMGAGMTPAGAHGHKGQTLLHIDRVSAMEAKLLNAFPILDYFTSPYTPQVDENGDPIMDKKTGKQAVGRPDANNYRKWIRDLIEKDIGDPTAVGKPDDLRPTKSLTRFINREAVWDDWVRTRLHKSAKNAGQWDHDDMDIHAAFMTDALVDQIVLRQGGATQQVSTPGLKNAVVGFSNFLHIKMNMLNENAAAGNGENCQKDMRQITDLITSFIKLDAVLDRRYYHGAGNYVRFSDQDWNSYALADGGRLVREHVTEARTFIKNLAAAIDAKMGGKDLTESWNVIIGNTKVEPKAQQDMIDLFSKKLDGAMQKLKSKGVDVSTLFQAANSAAGGGEILHGAKERQEKQLGEQKDTANVFEFRPYEDREMKYRYDKYIMLTQKIGETPERTPEQVQAADAERLRQILNEYGSGDYSVKPDDARIMDEAINARQSQLNAKMKGNL